MADNLAMAAQLTGQTARCGWYFALRMLADRKASGLGDEIRYRPKGRLPSRNELLRELGALILEDAQNVRAGLYPLAETQLGSIGDYFARLRDMMEDVPRAVSQRHDKEASTAARQPLAEGLPDYFTQDFHYQDGGYLSEQSARLYDVQVDTLFMGASALMRRAALRPIARHCKGQDQRQMALLDVACGTGRSLREFRLAFPAMKMAGIDLSQPYLDEARRHLRGLRAVKLLHANAEELPLQDASQDIVAMTFLYHELPDRVRRRVSAQVARVLKPGGLFVFIDSLQMGDRPEWDGMLEVFPLRFHEPYYRSYAMDDLAGMFAEVGLELQSCHLAFLSKVIVLKKTGNARAG